MREGMWSFEGRAVGQGKSGMLMVVFDGDLLTEWTTFDVEVGKVGRFNWFPRNWIWRFYKGVMSAVTLFCLGCDSLWLFMVMNNELCL
jgi:hypothetical protein